MNTEITLPEITLVSLTKEELILIRTALRYNHMDEGSYSKSGKELLTKMEEQIQSFNH